MKEKQERQNLIIKAKTFLRNNTSWYAFYCKLATFSDFEKIHVFLQKTHLFFFQKNPKFWAFWEFYYFSRILRQMCYKLVKNVN